MYQIYYYNYGYKFTESYSRDEAVEIIEQDTPFKNVSEWSDYRIASFLQELFTP